MVSGRPCGFTGSSARPPQPVKVVGVCWVVDPAAEDAIIKLTVVQACNWAVCDISHWHQFDGINNCN